MKILEENNSVTLAPRLLGSYLVREVNRKQLIGKIVETESYFETDPASHSYRGKTNSNAAMFLNGGHFYVYISYGIHFCLNIVTGQKGVGEGVLIRALEPIEGINQMKTNRNNQNLYQLTNGPAKLTQALKINKGFNSEPVNGNKLKLIINEPVSDEMIIKTNRIGISKAQDKKYRFYIKDNDFVSKK